MTSLLKRLLLVMLVAPSYVAADAAGEALAEFESHYESLRQSKRLRDGNEPFVLYHGHFTQDVVVLVHGLTDSPAYMRDIANVFFKAGANVVAPLLPGHGLKEPGRVFSEPDLYEQWRAEVDFALEVASRMGGRVSVGGFSTGGALMIDKVLRHPDIVTGGVFLYSAALRVTAGAEFFGGANIGGRLISRVADQARNPCPSFPGEGRNPFKYPLLSFEGANHLVAIIDAINSVGKELEESEFDHPIFVAHSVDDDTANIEGIVRWLRFFDGHREFMILSEHEPIGHANLVLRYPIAFLPAEAVPACTREIELRPADANPRFDGMMGASMNFFESFVRTR